METNLNTSRYQISIWNTKTKETQKNTRIQRKLLSPSHRITKITKKTVISQNPTINQRETTNINQKKNRANQSITG